MPKLSVIVPTFNASAYIERCLHSIRIQSFRDYEVVLEGGAYSDDTIRIAVEMRIPEWTKGCSVRKITARMTA